MGIREDALALADELEAFEGDTCKRCAAYKQPECKVCLPCSEIVSKYCARRIREAVERDGECATTVSAYDLLPDDDRKAIAWVREHGGLGAVEKRLMPEGMEWPKVDGKPVDFKTLYVPSLGVLEAVSIYNTGACQVMSHDGIIKSAKDIHIEKPEVLAADGKPLEVGQTVWRDDGEMLEVLYLRPDGLVDCCGEIERPERLTHDRPVLDADGVLCREGDEVWEVRSHRRREIVGTHYRDYKTGEPLILCDGDDEIPIPATCVTHKRPVLDADGVEIREGDTVYVLGFGEPLTVKGFTDDGRVLMSFHGENSLGYKPSKLTHEQPDTWERLEEDARQLDIYLNDMTDDYPRMSCCRDLVRRCRALVEKEDKNE